MRYYDRMEKKVTDAMLFRFFAEQTTLEETDMISAWLNEDPEKNQKVLDKAYNLYVLGIMCAPNPEAGINNSRSFLRFGWPKVLRYAGVAAAILLLGIAVDHVLLSQRMNRWLQQQTTVEVPAGQHIRLTLGDGSIVELNAQSRIVYPAIFPKGERRVQLSGEAIFNVAHNSECPFIVETFACDVEVLGTHFDVIANQAENRFSTALFSGRVAVTNKKNGESVILQPNDIVNLRDGGFQIQELEDKDDYLWMDGIISVYGMPFEQLMSKFREFQAQPAADADKRPYLAVEVVHRQRLFDPDFSRRAIWISLSKWPMLQTIAWSRIFSMCSSVMMSQLPVQVT